MNVPDEALDAVAEVLFVSSLPDDTGSARMAECIRLAALCLQAGGSAIAAQAWDEGFENGSDWGEWAAAPVNHQPDFTNPYRSGT